MCAQQSYLSPFSGAERWAVHLGPVASYKRRARAPAGLGGTLRRRM